MKDIAKLTPSLFTKKSGIKVNYTVLDEGTLRQVTTRDVAAGGRQFDVAMIGPYEAPQFGQSGSLVDLTPFASADKAYRLGDIIPAVRNALSADGKLYAAPFYGESSFLMYRKDVMKQHGITVPSNPTWQQVADIAAQGQLVEDGRHLPARQAGLGRPRCLVHHSAQHVRRDLVVRQAGRLGRQGDGRPAAFRQALQFYTNLVHRRR
jgi:sorbitol/mannitol transport system substrate-binding protein